MDDSFKNTLGLSAEEILAELGQVYANEEQGAKERAPTPQEIQTAAELSVFLEDDLGIDVRRLYIRVKKKHVYIQGSVENEDQLRELEELLPQKPQVESLEIQITVQPTTL